MAIAHNLRLIGSPDTNKIMMGELSRLAGRALGKRPPPPQKQGRGAILYPFDADLAYVAVHYHRTATRVLWDLYESRAQRLEPLYDELVANVAADDRAWSWHGAGISVRARNVGAFAAGERQVVGTVKNAVIDGMRQRAKTLHVEPDSPDIYLAVRMHDDTVTVSIDLVGASLSQRGYRTEHGVAPLREHLAAAMCMSARYDPRCDVLLDPMCGAGTICIEGALMAKAAPLWGRGFKPAMTALPLFRAQKPVALDPLFGDAHPIIIGNDIDNQALQAARSNCAQAGLVDDSEIVWRRGDFWRLSRDEIESLAHTRNAQLTGGLILSNPPYGQRMGDDSVRELYRDLGDWCSEFRGWRAGFLVVNRDWPEAFGRRPRMQKPVKNGPMAGYFYLYEL